MSITDWIIILLFLGGLIAIGFAFSKKNKDLKDYFLAGKSMPTWLVVFAATGTSISAGTFVGSPELGFNTNLTFIMSCVGAVIGGVVVAALFLPKLYNSRTITIYGYIGDRFGETSKRATSVMFILGQLFTSGSRLFIAAIAVSVIIFGSIHFRFLMYSIIILGIVSTIYTMAGGIKGLLYIDAIQIMLVIGSGLVALIIVFLALHDTMSLSEIFASLQNGMVKAPAQPEYAMAADGTLSGWIPGSKIMTVRNPRIAKGDIRITSSFIQATSPHAACSKRISNPDAKVKERGRGIKKQSLQYLGGTAGREEKSMISKILEF